MQLELCVSKGRVVTAAGSFEADIGVKDGCIAAISSPGELTAARTVDARDKIVLPGVIDPHLHYHMWERPFEDDCISEGRAAAAGGVTTLGIYIVRKEDAQAANVFERGGGRLLSVAEYREVFEQHSLVDGFFLAFVPEDNPEKPVETGFREGVAFFKVAWGRSQPSDAAVFRAFRKIKELGPPARALVHCEDVDICRLLEEEIAKTGRQDPEAFLEARPAFCEVDGMERYIRFAEAVGCPLYIVHVTIAEGPRIIADARRRGVDVVGETCPQYLTHASKREGIFVDEPQLARVNPPLRDRASNESLWAGLRDGSIDIIGTDHSPRKLSEKKGTIWQVPPGLGNLTELILPVLFSEGVNKGKLSLEQLVRVTSYNAAKILGLYPRKGCIAIGSDADLVILDPKKRVVLSADMLHSRSDYSIYEGWNFSGWPVGTILRGQLIMENGEIVGKPGCGKYLSIGKGA